ncbi:MAG TPA: hypothetical protein DCP40_02515 [Stenotrophomonas sp.]|nr:hypothetical protein [Stenotrophomonas sp.]
MRLALLIPALCALLVACAPPSTTPAESAASPPAPARVGGDRDEHGCIGSAGYQWCARSQRCERPWELAQAQGLANTAEAIDAWCAAPPRPARP